MLQETYIKFWYIEYYQFQHLYLYKLTQKNKIKAARTDKNVRKIYLIFSPFLLIYHVFALSLHLWAYRNGDAGFNTERYIFFNSIYNFLNCFQHIVAPINHPNW